MSNLRELESLDLASVPLKGPLPTTRLKDVSAAIGIFSTLLKADELSAVDRARRDAMFDGSPPYNQSKLNASGQSLKTNLNWNEGQRLLDINMSAYVDLYSSLERLVDVRFDGTVKRDGNMLEMEEIIADELTQLFRSWPEFHSSYLRLCTTFVKHGVGIAYFDNPDDWRFRVGGFADILIPRQTPASEEAIEVAVGRRRYQLHELYRFIQDEKAAAAVGWNVPEVRRVMSECVRTSGRTHYTNYEELQAELKNNDLYNGVRNPAVDVLHFWVREINGSVSHFICVESNPKDFMFKKVGRYESPEQAYVFFTHGVGTNGTYHSVRGLGHRIFNHVQTSNRLRCQMVDGAMLASSVMIQPETQRALDELSFTMYGGYSVLSPNVRIIEKAIPNLATAVQPALQDLGQQLALNTDTVSPYGPQQASPYRNQMQVVADMDIATRLSGASLNLFYASWSRLLREMTRRALTNKRRDPLTKEFHRRCEERGVPAELLKRVDTARTKAVRAIGNGSAANRLVALRELQGVAGTFPDSGRRNLTRDIVSTRVGFDLADRYMPNSAESHQTLDTKIALLENAHLQSGQVVPVVSSELHGEHLRAHMPAAQQLLDAYNTGQVDPRQLLPAVQTFYEHISQTNQYAAADPYLQGLVGESNQLLQYLEEIMNNVMKELEAEQRRMAEEGGEGGEAAADAADQMKLARHDLDMRIKQEKAQLDMSIKQRKFEQDQMLRDAKAAMDFREEFASGGQPNQPLPENAPFSAVRVR